MAAPEPSAPAVPRRWLREPLVHFVLLGALIFIVDAALASRQANPNVITLSAEVDEELQAIFSAERQRPPNETELNALRQRWFDNELLYREGLALGLDRGDTGIRERVIFKALNVVAADVGTPAADEAELRAWFETQRHRYDEPPRIDFMEARVQGTAARELLEHFASVLNNPDGDGDALELESNLRVYTGRPLASIPPVFGDAFAEALETLPPDTWQVLDSDAGPRVVRVEARTPGAPAAFDNLRDAVRADWQDQRAAEMRSEAIRALGAGYTLRVAAEQGR